jgi:tetratricopeptide (TPR) repeat protein
VGAAILALLVPACGSDPADREYLAALRGEESGMTREQQIARLDRAIELAPTRAVYFETRAVYRIDRREFALARQDLDRAIQLLDRPYVRFLRGLVSCQAGDYAASLFDFDAAIGRQPENAQFYRGRSLARAAINDAAGALDDADRLVSLAPQLGEAYYARGVALTGLGRPREAIREFDRAHRIRPELVYVLEARALAHERSGNPGRAEADRRAAREHLERHGACAPCLDPFRY